MRTNDDKMKGSYRICSSEMEQKRYLPWSPLEKNKFATKHTYVSCSRSVPRRNKHFVQYNMSRSLNSERNMCGSSPENSSFEEDKRMSRSSKIMKALNFHKNLSHYGKTKIKKSLNFNLTPSPKRFPSAKKRAQIASSLKLGSSLSILNKLSDSVKDQNDSANSSFAFNSSDSIDENQNETPLRRRAKEGAREMLHYSTPNAKLNTKSLRSANFTPLLRSRLKETIADLVHVNGTTPDSKPLKSGIKVSSRRFDNSMTNTSRNLFYEFHEDDDERPQTPENVISIIPESMSAIKRSHKKERSSRRSGHCVTQLANGFSDPCVIENTTEVALTCEKNEGKPHLERLLLDNSEADISDTGSLFDYAEESTRMANSDSVSSTKFQGIDVKETTSQETVENICEIANQHGTEDLGIDTVNANDLSSNDICTKVEDRSITPESTTRVVLESETSVTPENRIHFLRRVAEDSIKKSHKKNKETNKTKLFGVKILQRDVETAEEEENRNDREIITERNESIRAENKLINNTEENQLDLSERSCTPEKVNSSRLLLSQFSSVKKSHKKDKHASMLSGFLKRQEYFNKEMDSARDAKSIESVDVDDVDVGVGVDVDVGPDVGSKHTENMETYSCLGMGAHEVANLTDSSCSLNVFSDKLSPSKRKIPLDDSLGNDTSVSCDSELQDCDSSQREFQIFTPLKRQRSLIASNAKEYLHFYDLSSGKDEYSEEDLANVNLSRCLTPVLSIGEHCERSSGRELAAVRSDKESKETVEALIEDSDQDHDYDLTDSTGRSTPRNMSTAELYSNLDSIKKSHKKNKRGNNSRKLGFNPIKDDACEKRGWQSLSAEIGNDSLEKFELSRSDCDENHSSIDLISSEDDNVPGPSRIHASEQTANTSNTNADIAVQNVTPPNCLKTKNYIRLLRETSIKRSHKKVRDQKKYEATVEPDQLSDDGSIFGDEEKSLDTECRSVSK
ncbi:uncharacterized protein LOC143355836 [Halictus rubicundus]|uniref:uncharacterized protein LOC143355836 n=1 Tax=Halictus rubicundus TaxID=77578 RepID=UPI0040353101